MFFFFGFGEIEKGNFQNQDLDLFFYDSEKLIHIATGGMDIINSKLNFNSLIHFESNFSSVKQYRRKFLFSVSENIVRNNLVDELYENKIINPLENYISFFKLMAKRGFYSYDKVNINDPYDYTFELIAKPIYKNCLITYQELMIHNDNKKIRKIDYSNLNLSKTSEIFPTDFTRFNLNDYL